MAEQRPEPRGAYIGTADCGCVMMVTVDRRDAHTGAVVAEAITCGLVISHATIEEARLAPFNWHEEGQCQRTDRRIPTPTERH